MPSVVKRFSLLRRNASMTPAEFSRHYREVHGPLAAAQKGFRQYAYRYDQNHVDADLLGGADPSFDGVTATYQVPRPDYRQGFFQHPDYANVRPDEERLFDLSRTVSLLGAETILKAGSGGAKAIVICRRADAAASPSVGDWRGVRAIVRNDLDTASASALGVGGASVDYGLLWEIWFESPEARAVCLKDRDFRRYLSSDDDNALLMALAVRDFTIFD